MYSLSPERSRTAFGTALFAVAMAFGTLAVADTNENDAIGFSTNHVFHGVIDGENVDIMTGNVNIALPLGPRYRLNEWFSYQLTLYYNSKIWEFNCPSPTSPCPGQPMGPDAYGQGFGMHFGRVYHHPMDDENFYRYQTPDGAEHFFEKVQFANCGSETAHTLDSAAICVLPQGSFSSPSGWIAYPGDGTRVHLMAKRNGYRTKGIPPTDFEDSWYATRVETIAEISQGQPEAYVDITYGGDPLADPSTPTHGIDQIADSAGRTIHFDYSGDQSIDIEFPWSSGITTYRLVLERVTLDEPSTATNTFSKRRLTRIQLPLPSPTPPRDEDYVFEYVAGQRGGHYGYVTDWKLPTGAKVHYYYSNFATGGPKPYHTSLNYREIELPDQSKRYRWSYNRFGDGVATSVDEVIEMLSGSPFNIARTNAHEVRVLDPFDNLTVYHFRASGVIPNGQTNATCDSYGCEGSWNDGMLYKVDMFAGPVQDTSRLVKSEEYLNAWDGTWKQYRYSAKPHANAVPLRARQYRTSVMTPGRGAFPTRTRSSEITGWTSSDNPVRKPTVIQEFDGEELYRTTYRDAVPTAEFHDASSGDKITDAMGNIVSRTHTSFDINRIKCRLDRLTNLGATFSACTDPLATGDVATLYKYTPQTGGGLEILIERKGGDDNSSYATRSTYLNGVVRTREPGRVSGDVFDPMPIPWYSTDRDVDPVSGLVIASRDPAQVRTDYSWDALGRLTEIRPTGSEIPTEIDYRSLAETRVRQVLVPDENEIESIYLYDELGRLEEEQKRNVSGGYDFRQTQYDIAGRVTKSSEWHSPNTLETDMKWTTFDYGLFTNPNAGATGEVDVFDDPLGRIAKVTRPDGSVTQTEYEGLATRITTYGIAGSVGPINSTTTYVNDSFGRVIEVDSPDDPDDLTDPTDPAYVTADAVYGYDELDRLMRVDLLDSDPAPGHDGLQQRFFQYDALGRLRLATNPENGTTEYLDYDARGNLLRYRDAAAHEFVNEYDPAGRLSWTAFQLGSTAHKLIENFYDDSSAGAAAGKLTMQKSYRMLNGWPTLVSTRNLYYGQAGVEQPCTHVESVDETAFAGLNGRLRAVSTKLAPWNLGVSSVYCQNELGLPYSVRYPNEGSSRTVSDVGQLYSNGVPWEIHDLGRKLEYVANVEYSAHGAITGILRGNGLTDEISRDLQGRPTGFRIWQPPGPPGGHAPLDEVCGGSGGGGPVEIQQCPPAHSEFPPLGASSLLWDTGLYHYDGAGNVDQIGQNIYGYDKLNRLTGATINQLTSQYGLTYGYDAYGNMTSAVKNLVESWTKSQSFAVGTESNRLTSESDGTSTKLYEHDPNGNMTRNADLWNVFDERNRLVEVWDQWNRLVASYDYDASGYRVRSVIDGIETYFFRNGAGAVLSEFRRALGVPTSQQPVWNKDYIYGFGQALTLVKNENPSPATRPWASLITSSGLQVQWNAVEDDDIAAYQITRTTSPPSVPREFQVDGTATSYFDSFGTDFVVEPTTRVFYTVKAVDTAANVGPTSPSLQIRYDGIAPPTPGNLVAEPLNKAVRLTWSAVTGPPAADLWGYKVERKTGSGSFQLLTQFPIQSTVYHDVGLANGTSYEYRVWSVDSSGLASAKTPTVSAIPRDQVAPGKPSGVEAAAGFVPYTIVVRWNPGSDDDLSAYIVYRTGCGTGPVQFPTLQASQRVFEDVVPTPYVDCTYTVTALDSSSNYSDPSLSSTAQARISLINGPKLMGAAFDMENVCDVPNACATCYVPSSDSKVGARISWESSPETEVHNTITKYIIYRAPGATGVFVPIDEVPNTFVEPYPEEYFDTDRNGNDYTYRVTAVASVGSAPQSVLREVVVPCDAPCNPGALHVVDPPFDPTQSVQSMNAVDSHGVYPTDNARSRSITVNWSPVTTPRLAGYHVYRKCTWSLCTFPLANLASMDTHACEDSWIRVTETPITTRTYHDGTTGGLSGCFAYAVRPVGQDGREGQLQMALRVNADTFGEELWCYGFSYLEQGWPRDLTAIDGEFARINAIQRGTGDAGGLPSAPDWSVEFTTKPVFESEYYSKVARVSWSHPDQPSDLAGYHVEMAGSSLGPWKRLTKRPVAWWESEYIAKGLGVLLWGVPACPPGSTPYTSGCLAMDGNYTGHVECAHFRVFAVDEDGNESAPQYIYPRTECPGGPTPPAPTGVRASTRTDLASPNGGQPCATEIEWDEVDYGGQDPALFTYYVYRFRFDEYAGLEHATTFYATHSHSGADQDCTDHGCCVNGVCSYVELGGDISEGLASPPLERDCPWDDQRWSSPLCGPTSDLSAFYVTVKGPSGGESPRSAVVFWDCEDNPGYAKLETCPSDEGDLILVAESPATPEVCSPEPPEDVLDLAQSEQPTSPPPSIMKPGEPAIAALLKLGQVSSGPPFKLIDLHVDHLGSTRVTTDEFGAIVAQHDFFPFGEEILPVPDESTKMFTGHERDEETGLDYMLARYYFSSGSRFVSTDPAFEINKSLHRPQRWNRYTYVLNNPVIFIDPTGETLKVSSKKQSAEGKLKETADSGLMGKELTIGADGTVGLTPNGDQGPPTEEQAALENELNKAINAGETIELKLQDGSSQTVIDSGAAKTVDMADIQAYGAGGAGPSATGMLAHVVAEQRVLQTGVMTNPSAHIIGGIGAENAVTGFTRGPENGHLMRDPNTGDIKGQITIQYTRGTQVVNATTTVAGGNITNVTRK